MPYSQNGYIAGRSSLIAYYTVPGSSVRISMRKGSVATVLLYVAHRIDTEVQNIDGGIHDDWGYAYRGIIGGSSLSNHASGTAIDLNATKHGRGGYRYSGYTSAQVSKIHKILKDCDGVVRWGGDYASSPYDPMHFEINRSISYVAALAKKISAGTKPGSWKGFPAAAVAPSPTGDVMPTRHSFTTANAVPLTPGVYQYITFITVPTRPDTYYASLLTPCDAFAAQLDVQLTNMPVGSGGQLGFSLVDFTRNYEVVANYTSAEFQGTSGVTFAQQTEIGGSIPKNCYLRCRIAVAEPGVIMGHRTFRSLEWR